MRIVSENLANARSTGDAPGADPYPPQDRELCRRRSIGRAARRTVEVERLGADEGEFHDRIRPGQSGCRTNKGMVKLPNVNVLVEMADMREANRSYEANLQSIEAGARPDLRDHRPPEGFAIMINAIETIKARRFRASRTSATSSECHHRYSHNAVLGCRRSSGTADRA